MASDMQRLLLAAPAHRNESLLRGEANPGPRSQAQERVGRRQTCRAFKPRGARMASASPPDGPARSSRADVPDGFSRLVGDPWPSPRRRLAGPVEERHVWTAPVFEAGRLTLPVGWGWVTSDSDRYVLVEREGE